MPPISEPTAADIAAVQATLPTNEAPVAQPVAAPPAPEPAPVAPPVATPAEVPPTSTDPFANIFTQPSEPTPPAPVAPVAPVQQPTEPTPQPQPPTETQPTPEPPVATQEDYQSFEDYMNETLKNVPKPKDLPNPENISPDDPKAIKQFFDDLVNTAVEKAKSETTRSNAIQARERALWDDAFSKYGSLRDKKPLRDMVHSIRMGYFQRGIAITPKQAADKLLESLGSQYKQGVADNQVVTTIENVQPAGGGSAAPVTTSMDRKEMLTAVQDGGEAALADILDARIKAGTL